MSKLDAKRTGKGFHWFSWVLWQLERGGTEERWKLLTDLKEVEYLIYHDITKEEI